MKALRNVTMVAAAVMIGLVGAASADIINATVTADNHYGVYVGNADGSVMQLLWNNEVDWYGVPGEYNWSVPESRSFNLDDGQQIYVVTWSDNFYSQGWIGQFENQATGTTIYSNVYDWVWMPTNADLNDGASAPGATTVGWYVGNQPWQAIPDNYWTNWRNNGDSPWGPVAGISTEADWVWGTAIQEPAGWPNQSGAGEFHIYTMRASVPEPGTLSLMAMGLFSLVGLAAWRRRK